MLYQPHGNSRCVRAGITLYLMGRNIKEVFIHVVHKCGKTFKVYKTIHVILVQLLTYRLTAKYRNFINEANFMTDKVGRIHRRSDKII